MEDFNSKYTGEQVEALLDIVAEGGNGGGEGEVQKTTETEILAMGFTKNLGTITEVKMNGASKGTSGVVDLGTVITEHQDISGKQDVIEDLDAIREGASKGATALQSVPSEYITESELSGKGYATTAALDNKVDKISGKQLSTEDFTSALKTKLEGLSNYNDATIQAAVTSLQTQLNTLTSGNTSAAIESFNEIIAFLDGIADSESLDSIIASIEQQIAGKQATISDLETIRSGAAKGATAVQPSSLSKVATSGSYNDLSNKPTIPSAVTESTVSGWGFTKNTGTYSKPSGGIPKSDLASAVQTSLGKADTALQSYTEQYKGTVTGVKVNGSTKSPSSGIVDIGTVITSHQDISGKQDKLVSGSNIKTINGQSILGSGNITIEGGSSSGGSSGGEMEWYEPSTAYEKRNISLAPNKRYYADYGTPEGRGFDIYISNNNLGAVMGARASLIIAGLNEDVSLIFQAGYNWVWDNNSEELEIAGGLIYEFDFLSTPIGILITWTKYNQPATQSGGSN